MAAMKTIQWRSHSLRFDGVYQLYTERIGFGDQYYRFYPDGTVLSHSGDAWAPETEAKDIYRGSRWAYQGRYSLSEGTISMTVEGWSGLTIPSDADQAAREAFERGPHTKTHYLRGQVRTGRVEITSADGYGEYRFVKVQFPQ
jgi:hypothetical protein